MPSGPIIGMTPVGGQLTYSGKDIDDDGRLSPAFGLVSTDSPLVLLSLAWLTRSRRAPRAGKPASGCLIDQALAPNSFGCRGFTGPVPPPLLMSASMSRTSTASQVVPVKTNNKTDSPLHFGRSVKNETQEE